jgi:hypothetical protein
LVAAVIAELTYAWQFVAASWTYAQAAIEVAILEPKVEAKARNTGREAKDEHPAKQGETIIATTFCPAVRRSVRQKHLDIRYHIPNDNNQNKYRHKNRV